MNQSLFTKLLCRNPMLGRFYIEDQHLRGVEIKERDEIDVGIVIRGYEEKKLCSQCQEVAN